MELVTLFVFLFFVSTCISARAGPRRLPRQARCAPRVINFDDAEFDIIDPNGLTDIRPNFAGFDWIDFRLTSCPGSTCKDFPVETTQSFSGPRLAMAQGLVGGILTGQFLPKTSPKAKFVKSAASGGTFSLTKFSIFDIIDLPTKLGLREDLRVHVECRINTGENIRKTVSFVRNKDTAGYDVTQAELGPGFVQLTECTLSTTQVFFPFGRELEIPTESMGLDGLEVCIEGEQS